jgi:hypothetical protein
MICRTMGRTIMFNQVEFPTINRHPRPDPASMFVRYPRHRPRSAPPASIRAMGRNPRKRNKVDHCDGHKFRQETAQIESINSINP